MENYAGEGPKWRLEHAATAQATCNQAACKRAGVKFVKGELRIGTHTLFDGNGEHRWYMAWRHWGCATKQQLKGLKEVTGNDATQAPGYDRLSEEAQEQVRLAFENDGVVDKEFRGVRTDLAKNAKKYGGEIKNAESSLLTRQATKSTSLTRAAACRGAECQDKNVKIVKGELRVGLGIPFDGEHSSWVYKHWKCMTKYDIEAAQQRYADDMFDGIDALPDEYQAVVRETFKKGEVIEPPILEMPKKSRAKKVKTEDDDEDGEPETPKPKRKSKKKTSDELEVEAETPQPIGSGTKRGHEVDDSSEPEYVPKKGRSRAKSVEEVIDPAVAKIEAMAAATREKAAE